MIGCHTPISFCLLPLPGLPSCPGVSQPSTALPAIVWFISNVPSIVQPAMVMSSLSYVTSLGNWEAGIAAAPKLLSDPNTWTLEKIKFWLHPLILLLWPKHLKRFDFEVTSNQIYIKQVDLAVRGSKPEGESSQSLGFLCWPTAFVFAEEQNPQLPEIHTFTYLYIYTFIHSYIIGIP